MAKTYLDELVEYPAKALQKISANKEIIALLVNVGVDKVTEDDVDKALDDFIFDYEYVDNTITQASAYIWAEADVPVVSNKQIKGMKLYITVACNKKYMKLNTKTFSGIVGNRRDNLVRCIDKILSGSDIFGIGVLTLNSVRTLTSSNPSFTLRELCYNVPDFHIRENLDENFIR